MYQQPIPNQQPPFIVTAPMQPQYNVQQHNPIPVTTNNNRSWSLITFGIIQLVVSLILFCICMWIISIDSKFTINYVTIFCCLYHVVLSILTIIGGNDVNKHRCLIGVCMGVAIVGIAVIASVTLILNFDSWVATANICNYHDCNSDYYLRVYVPVAVNVSIQAIIDLIVSILNCVNICQCCGAQPQVIPGQILQQQFIHQPPVNNFPYASQAPPYTFSSAPSLPDAPINEFNVPQSNYIA